MAEYTPRAKCPIDIAQRGLAMLHSPDIPAANAWLRRNFRVWCDERAAAYVEIVY